jgi:hypothetical protein
MLKSKAQISKSGKRREGGGQAQGPTTIRHVIPRIEKGCCDTLILIEPEKETFIMSILKKHEQRWKRLELSMVNGNHDTSGKI